MKNYFIFPNINPIIFSTKFISIHWYGIMYLLGFIFAMYLGKKRLKNFKEKNEFENLLYISFLGLIIGGRIGYILFYNIHFFLEYPIEMIKIWKGGMSFHGGLIGGIVVIFYFSHINKKSFFIFTDLIAPLIPFGIGAGRLGNFINGELWGRLAIDIPWAIIFPMSYNVDKILAENNPNFNEILIKFGALPRHPSQIYEFLLEGILLFFILNIFILKKRPKGAVSGLFLFLYGIFRYFIEFFREPDIQLGFFINSFTMGQILSLPMIIIGALILIKVYKFK